MGSARLPGVPLPGPRVFGTGGNVILEMSVLVNTFLLTAGRAMMPRGAPGWEPCCVGHLQGEQAASPAPRSCWTRSFRGMVQLGPLVCGTVWGPVEGQTPEYLRDWRFYDKGLFLFPSKC